VLIRDIESLRMDLSEMDFVLLFLWRIDDD